MDDLGIALCPPTNDDTEFLFSLALERQWGFRWAFADFLPTFEVFRSRIWSNTSLRYVLQVEGRRVGLCVAWGSDGSEDDLLIDLLLAEDNMYRAWGHVVLASFLDYLFLISAVRKVRMEVPVTLSRELKLEETPFQSEGCLTDFYYLGGEFIDMEVLSAWSDGYGEWRAARDA